MLEKVTGETNTTLTPPNNTTGCHTFTVSLQSSRTAHSQTNIFRTYDSSQTASISEALLATIADPMFFTRLAQEPIPAYEDKTLSSDVPTATNDAHEDKPPGYSVVSTVDRSSPIECAISEAKHLWKRIGHVSIISLGAGKQYNAVLYTPADLTTATLEKMANESDDIATRLFTLATDYTFTNSVGQLSLQMSTKCEESYQQILSSTEPQTTVDPRLESCVRFNVDKGVD